MKGKRERAIRYEVRKFSMWQFLGSEHILSTKLPPLWDVLQGRVSLKSLGSEVQNVQICLRGASLEADKKHGISHYQMCQFSNVCLSVCFFLVQESVFGSSNETDIFANVQICFKSSVLSFHGRYFNNLYCYLDDDPPSLQSDPDS